MAADQSAELAAPFIELKNGGGGGVEVELLPFTWPTCSGMQAWQLTGQCIHIIFSNHWS